MTDYSDNAIIKVQNLAYAYPGARQPTIEGIEFAVQKGTIFGLLGPSGAGKSTVQRILTRQIRRLDAGSVRVLGRDIGEWDHTLYERVGVGFELPNHYPNLTAIENLKFFASLYASDTQNLYKLLHSVGLEGAEHQRVSEYSKGMQVRLNFARAIVHDPALLFLDEPTSGLDPTTAEQMLALIEELRIKGKTIVLTTHNMHDAERLCDRVGFLANGRMVAVDSPGAFKQKYGERYVNVSVADTVGATEARFPLEKLGDNSEFLSFLQRGEIQTMHSQEASLDTVFQIVTGESLTGRG
nr:ABC transporter ATP-binding protein [Hyphomonas sp. Mor2]